MIESSKDIAKMVAENTDRIILEQLNDFISRDLIVLRVQAPVFVRSMDSNKIELRQFVSLELKDKEYVEKLEKENEKLKNILNKLKENLA